MLIFIEFTFIVNLPIEIHLIGLSIQKEKGNQYLKETFCLHQS